MADASKVIDYDFTQSTLAAAALVGPTLSFTRATDATHFDSAGVLQTKSSGNVRLASHVYVDPDWVNKGYLAEGQRINRLLHNRDWTNAAYTATSITAAKDATGLDGVANSASTLTADANNGTIFQSVTLGSLARTSTCHVKRKTGSGTVEFSDDGGSTYTDITASLSTALWFRASKTTTQANPSIGFRLGTSGDEIEVDFGQIEDGSFATSEIATTTAAVTRNADQAFNTADIAALFNDSAGTIVTDVFKTPVAETQVGIGGFGNAAGEYYIHQTVSTTSVRVRIQTTGDDALVTNATALADSTDHTYASAWQEDDAQLATDGTLGTQDTTVDVASFVPAVDRVHVGDATFVGGAFGPFNGFIKTFAYFDERKSDAFLQSPDLARGSDFIAGNPMLASVGKMMART